MALLRCLLISLFQQLRNDLIDDLVGQGADFVLSFWLNWMLHQDRLVLGHAQGRALRMCGANKFRGRYICGRDAFFFKVYYIVRTARNAGPSIAQGFDDGVTFLG